MTLLVHGRSGRSHRLGPLNSIGRATSCDVTLPPSADRASRLHALLHWSEGPDAHGWRVRDLHSRNGTFVDGQRVPPGRDVVLPLRGTVAFGGRDDPWSLAEPGPPPIVMVGSYPDHEVRLVGRALILPHDQAPRALVTHVPRKGWVVEMDDEQIELAGADPSVVIDGIRWRASLPREPLGTVPVLARVGLVFRVAAGDEFVTVLTERGGQLDEIMSGPGSALYFLLTLARRRLADAELPEDQRGWVHVDELAEAARCSVSALNQWVFRLRRRFAARGFDEGEVVERRARTGLLRIGWRDLRIERAG